MFQGHIVFNGHRLTLVVIYPRVIRSFRSKETEKLFRREQSRRFGDIGKVARRKLRMLDDAEKLEDLAAIPGNRLEAMSGERKVNTASGSMIDGASVLSGMMARRSK